jgi:hypothetical protein
MCAAEGRADVPRVFAQQIVSHQRKVTAMQTDLIEHMVVSGTREGKAACGRRPRKSIHQLASHFRDNSGRLANECSRTKNLCFPARSNTSNFNARTDFLDMGIIGVHKMSVVTHNARITAYLPAILAHHLGLWKRWDYVSHRRTRRDIGLEYVARASSDFGDLSTYVSLDGILTRDFVPAWWYHYQSVWRTVDTCSTICFIS